jgi:hypothetical protein
VNRTEAIKLLVGEGWKQADAIRALESVDFKQNPDELTVRRAISRFAGAELDKRQRLQAAQKGMVTKRSKELEGKAEENSQLYSKVQVLATEKDELAGANEKLKRDNKALKNLIDQIKLKIALDMGSLMKLEDSEIRKALLKWFKSFQG